MDIDEAKRLPGFADLLKGFCNDIPSQKSTTVRVFLSSTFTGDYSFELCNVSVSLKVHLQ